MNIIKIFHGKRVAITGGTGFVGSHLLESIHKQKPKALLLVSRGSSTNYVKKYLPSIKLNVYRSIDQYVSCITNFDPDYLFILGGNADPRLSITDPKYDLEHNLLYNFHLLEKLREIKNTKVRIIYMSSVAVYGESSNAKLNAEKSKTIPKSPLGISKLAMEGYIRFYSQTFNIKGISIRLFSTYGPHLKKQVVYDFIRGLLIDPNNLHIRGDGSEIRDLTYIDDQIDGILALTQRAEYKGEIYNLGSGQGISISSLASKIAKLMNLNPKVIYEKQKREKYHGHTWVADITPAVRLKHKLKISINEGLERTITWVKRV